MRWSDLPPGVQRDFAAFKGTKPPEAIQESLDQLERDAGSWLKAMYKAITGKTLSQARHNASLTTQPSTSTKNKRKRASR
jgi:hypothetical protein